VTNIGGRLEEKNSSKAASRGVNPIIANLALCFVSFFFLIFFVFFIYNFISSVKRLYRKHSVKNNYNMEMISQVI